MSHSGYSNQMYAQFPYSNHEIPLTANNNYEKYIKLKNSENSHQQLTNSVCYPFTSTTSNVLLNNSKAHQAQQQPELTKLYLAAMAENCDIFLKNSKNSNHETEQKQSEEPSFPNVNSSD